MPKIMVADGNIDGLSGSIAEWGLGSNQDYVHLINLQSSMVMAVADGHSKPAVIEWIRELTDEDWLSALSQTRAGVFPNPIAALEADLHVNGPDTRHSGACLILCALDVDEDKCNLEIWSVGDCKAVVRVGTEVVCQTVQHSPSLESEIERIVALQAELGVPRDAVVVAERGLQVGVTGPDGTPRATTQIHRRVRVRNASDDAQPACLQPSRCIGHCGGTGDVVDYQCVSWSKQQAARVLVATDGLFDVCGDDIDVLSIAEHAGDVVKWAAERWLGNWHYVHHDGCTCCDCVASLRRHGIPWTAEQPGIAPDDVGVGILRWKPRSFACDVGRTEALQQRQGRLWCPSPGCLLAPAFATQELLDNHIAQKHPTSP